MKSSVQITIRYHTTYIVGKVFDILMEMCRLDVNFLN